MTQSLRRIAILRADTMTGSDFILPIMIRRVIGMPFPKTDSVYELLREGGFTVEYSEISIDDERNIEGGDLEQAFRPLLQHRPVFVEIETGNLFIVRSPVGLSAFVVQAGQIMTAFTGKDETILASGPYEVAFTHRHKIAAVYAIRTAKPEMEIRAVKDALENGQTFGMTVAQMATALLTAIKTSATKHCEMRRGAQTTEFGPVRASDIITSLRLA